MSNRGDQLLALRKLHLPTVEQDGAKVAGASLKSVLRAIDDHAGENGSCWATVDSIAIETCLSDKTVRRAIRSLVSLGYVVSHDRKERHTGTLSIDCERVSAAVTITATGKATPPVILTTPPVILTTPPVILTQSAVTVTGKARETKRNEKKRERSRPRLIPTLDEVRAFWKGNSLKGNGDSFYMHYEANGWVQGKNKPIRKWQMAAHAWSAREGNFKSKPVSKVSDGVNFDPTKDYTNAKF